nr:putative transporter [Quercus suber]
MGIKNDIHLTGDDYQWLSSMFYFVGLDTRFLERLPLAKYSSACVIAWGTVLCCFAAVQDFGGAVAIRFLLGVCEAAVTPGFVLLTSQWYTNKEQGTRTGIWVSFNGWAQILGGLVAYGIAKGTADGQTSLAGWKIVFLVTGLLTVVMGVIFWFVIPDNQLNARWLSKEDRVLAVERIRINSQGIGNKTFKWYQFREAMLDPLTWAFFFFALIADIPNGGISNFFSQLIVSFGYTAQESLLYGTPGGAVEIITLVATGWAGDRYGNRLLFASTGYILSIIGMSLIVGLPLDQNSGRLGGYYLTQASTTGFICFLSLISSNVSGYTKKTTVCALFLIGYCVGNIIGEARPTMLLYSGMIRC